jgi:hypothetical protein
VNGRRVASRGDIERPGDYFGPTGDYTNGVPAVFFLKPNARDADTSVPARSRSIQHVCSPPRSFRECADGSLEIRPSISNLLRGDADGHSDDGWHGWLDKGHVWRRA